MRKVIYTVVFFILVMAGAPASFAQTSNTDRAIEVPFDFHSNEIILQVKVNGKGTFNMMLDTGTDPSAVDLATAKELGLKLAPTGKQALGGGTNVNLTYETKFPVLEAGGIAAKNIEALAIDLSELSKRFGMPIHGVLGHNLLNNRIVQIDYPGRVIRFYAKLPVANQANTAKRTVLSFRYDDSVLVDGISVNGKKVIGDLDTGSNGTFGLTPVAATTLGLDELVSKARVSSSMGYNGVSENREAQIDNIKVGDFTVDAPVVVFYGKGTGRDKKPWGVKIGNAFLKDFVVTIDYRGKSITLERP